jgi:hypothetical protein
MLTKKNDTKQTKQKKRKKGIKKKSLPGSITRDFQHQQTPNERDWI